MKVSARLVPLVFVVLAIVTAGAATMQDKAGQTASMAEAAQAFLDSLTPEQHATVMFPFNSDDRFDWHYIPRERKGVPLVAMTTAQKKAALALVEASLSAEGYNKTERIRQLEQILFDREGRAMRNTELYFFMVFGEPSTDGNWGWRYEGHHISQNFTVLDGVISATTPQFFGTNPAHVREGSRAGERVLVLEDVLPRSLLASMSAAHRRAAIVSDEAPSDILTTSDRKAGIQENNGVAFGDLSRGQQDILWALIEEYAEAQPAAVAAERLDKVKKAGLDGIRFAWLGSLKDGEPHYYRVQGPTFLIEYDNVQNGANHVHSVWRDFDGDFGRDMLAAHYRQYAHDTVNAN